MTTVPSQCVVDTNVPVTANGMNSSASATCVAASARALQAVMSSGHLFLDNAGRIVLEYRRNLHAEGQPGPGDAFLRWVLTNEWSVERVTRVDITAKEDDPDDFVELPPPPVNIFYDPSDRKFLAVALAADERPSILQSLDSKWWGWRDALANVGITVCFLCPEEIAKKHAKKVS